MYACGPHQPPLWPERFVLVQRKYPDDPAMGNETTITFYDWLAGANLIKITPDSNHSDVLWDLELNTRHSFYFRPARNSCQSIDFPVGILRPDWLNNATYLGRVIHNGRECFKWTKVDFIDYYAATESCEPVAWYFHSMRAAFETIYYQPGAHVPHTSWFTPPEYCSTHYGIAAQAFVTDPSAYVHHSLDRGLRK
eukprot:CAMPEP_0119319928 /NCGR_PEP_ID=MMETSP1333-20130426/50847_1 /TAXON_ID=418940 /ORGANISM="Scyphosphaera apsteinii, Strain RCC1455" /LENGTH=194 /DNA_ID=CAMNT_0007326483 /DNA_START=89 /DNA_END=673 /DNA_ORIENTATION=+